MFLDSLNSTNFKSKRIDNCLCEKPLNTIIVLPTILIFVLVAIPFLAVLNKPLFQVYFYDNYGFIISCFAIAMAVVIFLLQKRFKVDRRNFGVLIYILLTLFYCVFSAILVGGGYRYIGVVFNTMGTVYLLTYCRLPKYLIRVLLLLLVFSSLFCFFTIDGYYQLQFVGDNVNSNYLGFFGVVILVYGNVLITYLRKRENIKVQIFRFFLCFISLYIIWECRSRGSLASWMFYFSCVYILPINMFKNKKVVTALATLISICGVWFTYFYITQLKQFDMPAIMEKSTATRYRLWSYFWDYIFLNNQNMIFGYGTHSNLRDIFGYGLHNIYIGIWYDIGIVGLLFFVIFIIITIRKSYCIANELTFAQLYAIVGFLSFMISDYFAVTFTGPLVIWNYALLGLIGKPCSD